MRILSCMDTTLELLLGQCSAAPTAAKLSRDGEPDIALLWASRPAPSPSTGTVVSLFLDPTAVPLVYPKRGVWQLYITACQLYKADIWVDACPSPGFVPAYAATRDSLTNLPVNCAPDIQPNLAALNPVIGFHASPSDDLSHTGIDTDVPYGTFLDPAPTLTTFRVTSNGATLQAVINPIIKPNGTPYQLYDGYGNLLASGALTIVGSTASFSTPLALACADYYLVL